MCDPNYSNVAKKLKLQLIVHPDDDVLHPLVFKGSDLHEVMVDEYGFPVTQVMFDAVVETLVNSLCRGVPFQVWDIKIFNEWKVNASRLEKYVRYTSPDAELCKLIAKWL